MISFMLWLCAVGLCCNSFVMQQDNITQCYFHFSDLAQVRMHKALVALVEMCG